MLAGTLDRKAAATEAESLEVKAKTRKRSKGLESGEGRKESTWKTERDRTVGCADEPCRGLGWPRCNPDQIRRVRKGH